MMASTFWSALKARLQAASPATRKITVQHVLPHGADLQAVEAALDEAGEQLGLGFELSAVGGEIVLIDFELAGRMAMQILDAFTEGRPLVTLRARGGGADLLAQLRELPLVAQRRGRAGGADLAGYPSMNTGGSAFDSRFDSRLDAGLLEGAELSDGQRHVLEHVLAGLRSPLVPVLHASFGPGANLRLDFARRSASFDAAALRLLRVQRELPDFAPGALPGPEAESRSLEATAWDLGLAAGPFPLLNAPADWWRTPLVWRAGAQIEHYSRVPRHIELAHHLQSLPLPPSELRVRARCGVQDLRRFLQAALVLGLLEWQAAPGAPS